MCRMGIGGEGRLGSLVEEPCERPGASILL